MSLIDELKEVLKRRRNVLDIFGTYKTMYDELLHDLANTYNSDIDTVASAFYLANYVMDNLQSEEGRLDDEERVQNVLKNLIKAKEHLTVDFETLVHIYSLIADWAVRIEKEVVKNARLLVNPYVITTNIVDIYAVPLFSFLHQLIPDLDLRWAMAELDASLQKRFSAPIYEELINQYPVDSMNKQTYFDAGFHIIRNFVDSYFKEKFKEGIQKLEAFGDIGRKSYNYACSLFYNINSRELYTDIARDDQIELTDQLNDELKNSLLINKIVKKPENIYNLLFAKYHVKLKIEGQRTEERFFYIQNFEEEEDEFNHDELLGVWNYFLLSEENVNLQSIISYSKQRCVDIRGIKRRMGDFHESSLTDVNILLSAWMEMYIHNLQEEYNFLELKDSLREQGFIPIGILKQSKEQPVVEMLLDTVKSISSKRMETLGIKSSMITKEQVVHLLDHLKLITDHSSNLIRLLLLQHNPAIEVEFYPEEILYEHQQFPGKHLLLLFSIDESTLAGLICPNEASLEFSASSLKSRQILSKINQLLTDLRYKNLEDARATKMDTFITRGVEFLLEPGHFWISGNIIESLVLSKGPSVSDRIDLIVKLEEERLANVRIAEANRQMALEKERIERLNSLQRIYFNDRVLGRLVDELALKMQNKILSQLKNSFPDVYKLESMEEANKIKLIDYEKAIEKDKAFLYEIRENYNELMSEISNDWGINTTKITEHLKNIWDLIKNLTQEDLS
ncbi:MAG: hypothetical protein ACFFAU_06670 [Candidatus Hodarchaeota archaeon]